MPQVVKNYQPTRKPSTSQGREPKYPWEKWFTDLLALPKGGGLKLEQHKDFECSTKTIDNLFRRMADQKQVPIILFRKEDHIVVQNMRDDRPINQKQKRYNARRKIRPSRESPPST